MAKTYRILVDTPFGDQTLKAGKFYEDLDSDIAQGLVDTERAMEQTPEEYQAELKSKLLSDQKKAWESDKANRLKKAKVVGGMADPDPRGGFKSFSHFAHDVFKAGCGQLTGTTEAFRKWTGQRFDAEGWQMKAPGSDEMRPDVGSFGGFLIPVEFREALLKRALEEAVVRPRATLVPMMSGTISIPAINDISHVTSLYGGIAPAGRDKTQQMTGTLPKLQKITLTLRELYGLCYVDNTILQWSPISLEPLLFKLFGEAIAFEEDDRYIWGNGGDSSLGIMKAPCLVIVSAEIGQTATTIVVENIDKMWSRMHPAGRKRAIWLANNDTFPQLAALHRKVGTAGIPVWNPEKGVSEAPYGTIYGRPLILSEKPQTLGTLGDMLLCDFEEYLIGTNQMASQTGGIVADASIHLRFDYNETAFRFLLYTDGQPWWSAALTPRRSTNTVTPFVALGSRT